MTREPRRTCIVCREVRGKQQLVRLVRRGEGNVVVDPRATAPGRGAYVCRGTGCVARLVKGARASQAFRRPSTVERSVVATVEAMAPSGVRVGYGESA